MYIIKYDQTPISPPYETKAECYALAHELGYTERGTGWVKLKKLVTIEPIALAETNHRFGVGLLRSTIVHLEQRCEKHLLLRPGEKELIDDVLNWSVRYESR